MDINIIEKYNSIFEVFESEVNYGFNNICLHYAISVLTTNRVAPLKTTSKFWNYTQYNLVIVAILTLGRIFDISSDAKYSIHKLFDTLRNNLSILSLTELKKRRENVNVDFDKYIQDKIDFDGKMYGDLAKIKKSLQKQYMKPYQKYRNSIIGHRLVKNSIEIDADNDFNYIDILNIYISLYNLYRELEERYHNGRGAKKLTFEELTSQIYSLEKLENRTPSYLYMARDYLKLYYLLKEHGSKTNFA